MFGLFKKKSTVAPWVIKMLKNVFDTSPEYKDLGRQVRKGMLTGVLESAVRPYGLAWFDIDAKVGLNFRDEKALTYNITDFEAFDKRTARYIKFSVKVNKGCIFSLTPFSFDYEIDPDDIRTDNMKKVMEPTEGLDAIKHLLTPEELEFINPSDVHEMEEEKGIYFLKMLNLGHCIAIDNKKNVYKINEDPYKKRKLQTTLIEILSKDEI